jgi:uncharacterized protein YndB with AHSA1/START domain
MIENGSLRLERSYSVPVEKVWKAISDNAEMKQWYFDIAEFRAEVGFEFSFMGGSEGGIQYKHLCRVVDAVPLKKLAYTWVYEGYAGSSTVVFELFAEGESSTRVVVTHVGLDTFPKDNPDLAEKNFLAGWTAILGELLEKYLVG